MASPHSYFQFDLDNTLRHTVVIGRTSSGKTFSHTDMWRLADEMGRLYKDARPGYPAKPPQQEPREPD